MKWYETVPNLKTIIMKYIIYVSNATIHFSDNDLEDLLRTSRENNSRLGITGMLLYADGSFIQVIEGEEAAIDGLYKKISRDLRHKSSSILMRAEIKERSFAEWSMGFKRISKEDFSTIAGFKDLSASSPDSLVNINKGPVLQLLKNFLKINSIEARYVS